MKTDVIVKVWGDYACFPRVDVKPEMVSYPIITPTAAKGLLDSIYWKPEMKWDVKKIILMKQSSLIPFKFNGVNVKSLSKTFENGYSRQGENAVQRKMFLLHDVEYIIVAGIDVKVRNGGNWKKHYEIAKRRILKGQHFHTPCLGQAQFHANVEWLDRIEESPLRGNLHAGIMYLKNYNDKFTDDSSELELDVNNFDFSYFNATVVDGVLDLEKIRG